MTLLPKVATSTSDDTKEMVTGDSESAVNRKSGTTNNQKPTTESRTCESAGEGSTRSIAVSDAIAIRRLQKLSREDLLLDDVVAYYLSAMESNPNLAASSKKAYRIDVGQFSAFMEELSIELLCEVELADLEAWQNSMAELQPNTRRRKMAAVSEMFKWARTHNLIGSNPVDRLERPRKRRKQVAVVSHGDFKRLLSVCETTTERGVLGVLFWAGLRRSEAAGLTVDCVDITNRLLRVEGKGGHMRRVPVCGKLVPLLSEALHARGTDTVEAPLFMNRWGNPLTPTNVNRWFSRWCKRAGLAANGYTPHSCRHGLGSLLGAEGVPSLFIAAILGHQDPKTTQGYVHGSPEQLKQQMDQIDVFGAPPSEEDEVAPQAINDLKELVAELSSEVRRLRTENDAA